MGVAAVAVAAMTAVAGRCCGFGCACCCRCGSRYFSCRGRRIVATAVASTRALSRPQSREIRATPSRAPPSRLLRPAGERTTGFNCICFNEATAENYIQPYARKGSRVVIQGHVENDTWTGKDGVEHYDLRLVVSDIRLKNRRVAGEPSEDRSGVADRGVEAGGGYDLNDDIPF